MAGREDLVREVLKLVPGVLLLVAAGALSRWIAAGIPHVSDLIVAIVLGIVPDRLPLFDLAAEAVAEGFG